MIHGEGSMKRSSKSGIVLSIFALSITGLCLLIGQVVGAGLSALGYVNPTDNPDFELIATVEIDMQRLKSYRLPIIIDFGSDTCIPCKEMEPVLKQLNEVLRGKAIIKFVDVKKYPSLTRGFPLRLIPTQIFIGSDGKPFIPDDPVIYQVGFYSGKSSGEITFTRHEGGMTKDQLLAVLKEMGVSP
jgi:thioredoxin 1